MRSILYFISIRSTNKLIIMKLTNIDNIYHCFNTLKITNKFIYSQYYLTLSFLSASFLKKNKVPFLLENVSNLTHEFLYDNFNKKI